MKVSLIVVLIMMIGVAQSQNKPTRTGKAEATGTCVLANSGTINHATINCGISEEQATKILSLLNGVLANGDKQEINSKLDELLKLVREGLDRRLTGAQIKSISNYLAISSKDNFLGFITYTGDRESLFYGQQFQKAFSDAHWPTDFSSTMSSSNPSVGISVVVNTEDNNNPPLGAVQMLGFLQSIGIECKGQYGGQVPKGKYVVSVGIKPANN